MNNPLNGFLGLLQSRKATFALLVFTVSSVALYLKLLDGISFAAIVATTQSVWQFVHSKQQIATSASNKDITGPSV